MANLTTDQVKQYQYKILPYKNRIAEIEAREKQILSEVMKNPAGAAGRRLALAEEMLNLASCQIVISDVSVASLGTRDENVLNAGRKSVYKSVIYLEQVVSSLVDAPYSEYEEKVREIESVGAARRFALVRKMGFAIALLEDAYGDNTKWRWSFVELEGRYAAVAKNIFDLKNALANTDPRSPDYEPVVYHLRLIKKLLNQAADRYREMYELSTKRLEDFRQGIHFLDAVKRIYVLMGDREGTETVNKKLEAWSERLEYDERQAKAERHKQD